MLNKRVIFKRGPLLLCLKQHHLCVEILKQLLGDFSVSFNMQAEELFPLVNQHRSLFYALVLTHCSTVTMTKINRLITQVFRDSRILFWEANGPSAGVMDQGLLILFERKPNARDIQNFMRKLHLLMECN